MRPGRELDPPCSIEGNRRKAGTADDVWRWMVSVKVTRLEDRSVVAVSLVDPIRRCVGNGAPVPAVLAVHVDNCPPKSSSCRRPAR